MKKEAFTFIGVAKTTTNKAEMNGEGVISALWETVYRDSLINHIPNKQNSHILALYTEYQSNDTGHYTIAIGTQVSTLATIPEKMRGYLIPEQKYVVFTSRRGPVQEVVVEAWQDVWEWSKTNERAYTTDFEVYDDRCIDPNNSQVDLYISVK